MLRPGRSATRDQTTDLPTSPPCALRGREEPRSPNSDQPYCCPHVHQSRAALVLALLPPDVTSLSTYTGAESRSPGVWLQMPTPGSGAAGSGGPGSATRGVPSRRKSARTAQDWFHAERKGSWESKDRLTVVVAKSKA